jgi:hypothetical protein
VIVELTVGASTGSARQDRFTILIWICFMTPPGDL